MNARCLMATADSCTCFRNFIPYSIKMYKAILVCIILIGTLASCTRDHAPGITCQDCTVIVSFNREVIPILSANCAITGCHTGAASTASNISFDSAVAYTQATIRGRYILPGNANASSFYSQLLSGANNHMPNNGGQLGPCDLQKIFCWINQGATNN